MNIIEVIPITRAIGVDTLSYFTSQTIPLGSLVNVPLRSKKVYGIVISSKKAEEMKSEIKNAKFILKKIENIKSINFFDDKLIKSLQDVANYYATSIGSIIDILIPEYILKNINKLDITNDINKKEIDSNNNNLLSKSYEKYAIQGEDEERFGNWKSLIRQEFAKKKSVFFLFPTTEECQRAYELLEKGINDYIYILHGSLNNKEIINNWNKIINEKHPVVIISTGGFLSIPRNDIETIIIERENSKSYKVPRRPYIDIRNVVEILAINMNYKLYFADNFLRLETLYRQEIGEIIQSSPFKFRSLTTAESILIDMKQYKNNDDFRIISDKVEELISNTKNQSEQLIILATRRGISPTIICGDCQNIVKCNNCSAPIVLHKLNEKSFFMCHRCGERRSANEYCKICNSWKLNTIGIGIDLIIEKIKEKFPEILIFKVDSDSVKNNKELNTILKNFKSKPGSILIGTEMILPYLNDKVENTAIISLDSLFSLPDFRIQERILHMLLKLRSIATKKFIVQTRKTEEKIFEFGLNGNINDFYKYIIEERKKFNYPPFTNLIKLTIEGKKDIIVKEMEEIQNQLDPYEVEIFPAFTHTIKGNLVLHGLIRVRREKWPDENLINKLKYLSPNVMVKIDPDSLL